MRFAVFESSFIKFFVYFQASPRKMLLIFFYAPNTDWISLFTFLEIIIRVIFDNQTSLQIIRKQIEEVI